MVEMFQQMEHTEMVNCHNNNVNKRDKQNKDNNSNNNNKKRSKDNNHRHSWHQGKDLHCFQGREVLSQQRSHGSV